MAKKKVMAEERDNLGNHVSAVTLVRQHAVAVQGRQAKLTHNRIQQQPTESRVKLTQHAICSPTAKARPKKRPGSQGTRLSSLAQIIGCTPTTNRRAAILEQPYTQAMQHHLQTKLRHQNKKKKNEGCPILLLDLFTEQIRCCLVQPNETLCFKKKRI